MMSKYLVVFSGSSDHTCESHKQRYVLIREEAQKRGYAETKLVAYPGQKSHDLMRSALTFGTSVSAGLKVVSELENSGQMYNITALSYGCNVLLEVLNEMTLNNVGRISLWGAISQVIYHQLLVLNRNKTYQQGLDKKGVRYGDDIFKEIPSFDLQLASCKQNSVIHISTGKEDTTSSPEYHSFLKRVFSGDRRFSFEDVVAEVGHTVDTRNEAYFNFLFGT